MERNALSGKMRGYDKKGGKAERWQKGNTFDVSQPINSILVRRSNEREKEGEEKGKKRTDL